MRIRRPALSWLPTFSRSTSNPGNRRPQIAKAIEGALGQIAVTRFNASGPIKYAKGTSTVVFGEFITLGDPPTRQPAVMFTALDYDRKDRESVAVCLYGSMDNFPEYVQAAGPGFDGGHFREGWVSSAAREIFNFLKSHGEQLDDPYYEPEDMAVEALKVADGQGMYEAAHDTELGTKKPWKRSFTYGDARKAEWLAQIYLDIDLLATEHGPIDGFRRVLVGAPLWIRTPHPRAIRLYATSNDRDVVADRQLQARRGSPRAEQFLPREAHLLADQIDPRSAWMKFFGDSDSLCLLALTITMRSLAWPSAMFVSTTAKIQTARVERMTFVSASFAIVEPCRESADMATRATSPGDLPGIDENN